MDEFDISLDWVGFELHPETPRGGMQITDLFPAARVDAMRGHLREAAARMSVKMGEPTRIPNSRRALALAEQARAHGNLQAARNAAMDAHWLEGKDIESDETLAEIARTAGLDPATAVAACDAPEWQARVDAMRIEASRWGVTGIPTFFFLPEGWTVEGSGSWSGAPPLRVVGCQPLPTLREVVRKVGAQPR
ncbi:MAG: putative DsbA family dithiol-disulfide isomerase, partial [Myxococcota bacterium]|jgi:predicted DsbA family dithiol-disulfide isomerase